VYHFAFDGKEFRVRFVHNKDEEATFMGKERALPIRGTTVCLIERRVADRVWELVKSGSAYCSINDQFNRSIGRKYSMIRATDSLDKDFKTAVFHTMFNKG
jgi:hypothetical protein